MGIQVWQGWALGLLEDYSIDFKGDRCRSAAYVVLSLRSATAGCSIQGGDLTRNRNSLDARYLEGSVLVLGTSPVVVSSISCLFTNVH